MQKYQINDLLCSETEKDLNPYSELPRGSIVFSDSPSINSLNPDVDQGS